MRVHARRPSLQVVGSAVARPPPGEVALALLAEVALGCALTVGAAIVIFALLLLVTVTSPLAALVLAWLAWRSDRDPASTLARLRSRWGRSARVIAGGVASQR